MLSGVIRYNLIIMKMNERVNKPIRVIFAESIRLRRSNDMPSLLLPLLDFVSVNECVFRYYIPIISI